MSIARPTRVCPSHIILWRAAVRFDECSRVAQVMILRESLRIVSHRAVLAAEGKIETAHS